MPSVVFWLKSPTGLQQIGPYQFAAEDAKKLATDFTEWTHHRVNSESVGTYPCGPDKSITIKFDEVAFIG
jgi:hypothetical protein